MKRRLLQFLIVLSVLPCAALLVLWVRAQGDGDQLIFTAGGRLWWVIFRPSGVRVATVEAWPGVERPRWIPRRRNVNDRLPTVVLIDPPPWRNWRRMGIFGEHGLVATYVDPASGPVSLGSHLAATSGGGGVRSAPMRFTAVHVPYWMALIAFGALPLAYAAAAARRTAHARRHRRRLAAGRCPKCGYDLRATPGRCPECGAESAATWSS